MLSSSARIDRLTVASFVAIVSFGILTSGTAPVAGSVRQLDQNFDLRGRVRPIRAVVVRSYGWCSSTDLIWDQLNQTWAEYGPIPISVDYSNPSLCEGRITYEALVQSGADVIILSDPAGGGQQYSVGEVKALLRYANSGHNLIGTYLTFGGNIVNNVLAPLFGLNPDAGYLDSYHEIEPTYDFTVAYLPLFRSIGVPYVSQGYPRAEQPTDIVWDDNELDGARYVAQTVGSFGAITLFEARRYEAIYITNMPEYQGGAADLQFFYNAITFGAQLRGRPAEPPRPERSSMSMSRAVFDEHRVTRAVR